MEEYILPEEERGFDEPVTVEDEFAEVTYQFNDSVIYMTDNLQQYLINVEADSILYLNSAMPKQYHPQPGMKLAASISHKLPRGLNHRVVSVEDVGGILRVVTTPTTIEDVYKKLSYKIDTDASYPTFNELDSAEMAKYGFELRDSEIVDWRTYDSVQVTRGLMTRAEEVEDKEYKEDMPDALMNWSFDTRQLSKLKDFKKTGFYGIIEEAIKKRTESASQEDGEHGEYYAALSFTIINHRHVHAERDEELEYEYNYQDAWTDVELGLEVGWEYEKSPEEQLTLSRKEIGNVSRFAKWSDNMTNKIIGGRNGHHRQVNWLSKANTNKFNKIAHPKFRIPIPTPCPVPLSILLGADMNPSFSLKGSICANVTISTAKTRTGYIVQNGEKTDLEPQEMPGDVKVNNAALNGSFKIGASFRAYVAFEVAYSPIASVGANVEAFIEGEGSINLYDKENGYIGTNQEEGESTLKTIAKSFDGKFSAYVKFFGDVQIHVAPLGIHIWDKTLVEFLTIWLAKYSTKLEPKVGVKSASCESDEGFITGKGYNAYSDLDGAHAFLRLRTYYPGMRMYIGPVKDNAWVDMLMDDCGEEFEDNIKHRPEVDEDEVYHFHTNVMTNSEDLEVNFMPYIYSIDKTTGAIEDVILMKDDVIQQEMGNPKAQRTFSTQIYSGQYLNFSHDSNGYINAGWTGDGDQGPQSTTIESFNQFEYLTTVEVKNGSRMQDWGLKVYIFAPDGKTRLLRRKIPVSINRSGKYTFIFTFLTNWEPSASYKDGHEECLYIRVQPYWQDLNGGQTFEATDYRSTFKEEIHFNCPDMREYYMGQEGSERFGTIKSVDLNDQSGRAM